MTKIKRENHFKNRERHHILQCSLLFVLVVGFLLVWVPGPPQVLTCPPIST